MQELLKDNLINAEEGMKFYIDKKRCDREFKDGGKVFLKLQPYRQISVNARRNQKLSVKYYGPYAVRKRVRKVACRLNYHMEPESMMSFRYPS